jgi:hypothetical protein
MLFQKCLDIAPSAKGTLEHLLYDAWFVRKSHKEAVEWVLTYFDSVLESLEAMKQERDSLKMTISSLEAEENRIKDNAYQGLCRIRELVFEAIDSCSQ